MDYEWDCGGDRFFEDGNIDRDELILRVLGRGKGRRGAGNVIQEMEMSGTKGDWICRSRFVENVRR
jgi:hypothetical protein